jgi:20S proteasome alpha/beta subunit
MTLVLGARCVDGVVVAADRKIINLTTRNLVDYDEKLYGVLSNVIFAYEGARDMFRVFLRYVAGDILILRDEEEKYTSNNLIQKLSNSMNILRGFRDEHSKDFSLSVMIARQFPRDGRSDLHVVKSNGKYEYVNEWASIGSAGITAKEYVKQNWNSNMVMREFAKASYCIIKYLEKENLDESVGVDVYNPSIKYLKDGAEIDTEPYANEFTKFEESYDTYARGFATIHRDK